MDDLFDKDIMASFLAETGYKKPPRLSERFEISSVLKQYHTITKVKLEVDQFLEELETLGVLKMMRQQSDLMKVFFVPTANLELTRGEAYFWSAPFEIHT